MTHIHRTSNEALPLDRAQARCEQLEHKLKKTSDFQLYLITKTPNDRAQMERLLMEDPGFRLWRVLTNSIAIANACKSACY
jgi:hypothetical protein